ncbi:MULTISPECIES: hydroxymethylglutaryl-CoA lyase [unclassified Pseudomonas]|uniref:hydroxymethylglutaryl-CoA lyase n=1 Tax=unclassified Pseudomonas TaxID=196821 RepID=UPI0035BFDC51
MFEENPNQRIWINEVAPRDGFQIESQIIPTALKVDLINRLSKTGVSKIEVTSFVSPKAIPALADADEVMAAINRPTGVGMVALVPNARGAERALACNVDEMNLVMSVSETHNLANLRMTHQQSFEQLNQVSSAAKGSKTELNLSLSCAFGCPMEGTQSADDVMHWVEMALGIGITSITLCDTTGMAWPTQVHSLCKRFIQTFPEVPLTAHFHNTRSMGLTNVLAAISAGVRVFDASLGGLGGCPYAPGASGNVCTEDMVHMLELMGYNTGVDLRDLIQCAALLPGLVGHDVPGQVLKAGHALDLHPIPAYVKTAREHALGRSTSS